MGTPTDRALLDACIEGDRRAWARFVERFTRYVYFLIQLTAKRYDAGMDEAEVADLHNDVFLALMEDDCRRLRAFTGRNGCSVRSWIRVITIRRTVDALRKRRHQLRLDAEDEAGLTPQLVDGGPDALEQLLERADDVRRGQLAALAGSLSERDRLLLHLLYTEKLSVDATAAVLRLKRGALYTRKTRLIQRLREAARKAGLLDAPE